MSLAEQYLQLACKQARAYAKKFFYLYSYDELQSAAFLALVEAEKTYDPMRKVGFAAYARTSIHNIIVDHVKEQSAKYRYEVPASKYFRPSELDPYDPYAQSHDHRDCIDIETEEEAFETIEVFEAFKEYLSVLKDDEHFLIIYRLHHQECSQKECAAALSAHFQKQYSQVTVSNMLKRAQAKYLAYQREAA